MTTWSVTSFGSGLMMKVRKQQYVLTKARRDLAVWAASFVLSLYQWHHIVVFFGNYYLGINIQAEQGILDGYPHWRVMQSHVLGPWLEKLVSLLFGFDLYRAHVIIAVAVLMLCSVVMFYAGRAIGGRQAGWSALLAFNVLFTLTISPPWLYIWDYFVLLAAAVFMLLMIRRAPWWSFLLLMSVAFFNHDGALFIGVWMVAKALVDAWVERRRPDWMTLGGGVLGSLGGILLMEYLRARLLKGETGFGSGPPPTDPLKGYYYFHLQPQTQFYYLIVHPHVDLLLVLLLLPLVLTVALAVVLVVRHGMKAAPLAIYGVTMVAVLLVFAIISETRTLLTLIPFLCLAGMLAAKPDWDTTSGGRLIQQR
jgi:hypothetical protein